MVSYADNTSKDVIDFDFFKIEAMMKLKEIRLKNFRCYENLTVPLNENLTVLVAPNGQGKTAILDAIAIALWTYVRGFDLAKPYPVYAITIQKDDIRIIRDERQNETGGMIRQFNTEIKATDLQGFSWLRFRDSEEVKSHTKEDKNSRKLSELAKNKQDDIRNPSLPFQTLPIFAYYGTGRLWNEKRQKKGTKDTDTMIRTFAYQNSLESASNYRQFFAWFSKNQIDLLQLWQKGKQHSKEYITLDNAMKNIQDVVNIMLKPVEWGNPVYQITEEDIVLEHEKHGFLKLNQLSDGIQNIFGMVADIAYRCYLLNSHLGENAVKETEGIVLIDEVDMHLHPEWQQTILADLQEAFPKIQFIVTTHSPQVLTTVPSKCIRMIDGQSIYFAPAGSKGAESSRLLNRIFGVASRPPEDENTKMLEEYRELVYSDSWNTERALQLRHQLDDIFQGEEPELTKLDLYIDNREWELSLEENQ